MTIKSPRIPGRTAKERGSNLEIIMMAATIYILQTSCERVHFDRRSRAERRYLLTLYYRLKWRKVLWQSKR